MNLQGANISHKLAHKHDKYDDWIIAKVNTQSQMVLIVPHEMRRIFILECQKIINLWITTIGTQQTFYEPSTRNQIILHNWTSNYRQSISRLSSEHKNRNCDSLKQVLHVAYL